MGIGFVNLKHWDERTATAAQLVGETWAKTGGIKEALVLSFAPPAIFGLGNAGGFEFYLQNRGEGGAQRLAEAGARAASRISSARASRTVSAPGPGAACLKLRARSWPSAARSVRRYPDGSRTARAGRPRIAGS